MSELYKAIAGSPITYLSSDISAAQTTISIADDSALPDAPNICTIGFGENIETIKYGAKSNGVLQEVVRGIEGTPRAWPAGTEVARFFTAYDHNAIIENFNSHLADYAKKMQTIRSTVSQSLAVGVNTLSYNQSYSKLGDYTFFNANEPTKFTIPSSDISLVKLRCSFVISSEQSSAGRHKVTIFKNGAVSSEVGRGQTYNMEVGEQSYTYETLIVPVVEGDYFEAIFVNNGDNSMKIFSYTSFFQIEVVR